MRLRFSIAWLLACIAFCGVGFAALHAPSNLWAVGLSSLTLAALVLAVINVLYAGPASRAFWVGFVVCGGVYFLAATCPWVRSALGGCPVTEALLDIVAEKIVVRDQAATGPLTVAYAPPAVTSVAVPPPYGPPVAPPPPDQSPATVTYGDALPPLAVPPEPAGASLTPVILAPPAPSEPPSQWQNWSYADISTGAGEQVGGITVQASTTLRQIGHSLFTLMFATLGGTYAGRRRARAQSSS
jgi:hypothetical protein